MLRIVTFSQMAPGGIREASVEELPRLLAEQGRIVWVDLQSPNAEEAAVLLRVFRFHPVAVEDALEDVVQPKVDDYQTYLYIVLHGLLNDSLGEHGEVEMHEVDFFLGKAFLVTHHEQSSQSVERTWERVKRQPDFFLGGADFIFAAIVERMIDRYMPLIETFDERVDSLEDEVFGGRADQATLQTIFGYKRSSLMLRRTIHPQREVIRNLSAGQYPIISKEAQILLRDVYDHLFTIAELIESYRDLLAGTLDAHISVASNKLNVVMKRLTVITTILMIVSLFAGIYGMNFDHIPFSKPWWGFYAMMGFMLASAAATIGVMRLTKWI